MPIFMDRHPLKGGVTVKDLADAHEEDTKIQDNYGCKTLTYWFDEKRQIAWCLVEAPDKKAIEEMHKNSHGSVFDYIIEVECNTVEIFLGRVANPNLIKLEEYINETAYRTVMFIELKYSLSVKSKPKAYKKNEPVNINIDFIKQVLKKYDGCVVNNSNEGIMATFVSVPNSIKCAEEIQNQIKRYNKKSTSKNLSAIISLCTGSPVTENREFFGDTIQLAKRLCAIAEEGQIIVSSTMTDIYKKGKLKIAAKESMKILSPVEEKFLNQLMEITEQIWNDERLNLDYFSKLIGLSKPQLYRKITSLTGCSPNVFIREYRLKKALKSIEKMRGNISEIAFESGFNNPSYFAKCFQKKFGILPSEYANTIGLTIF